MLDPRELDRCVVGAAAAHQRLLAELVDLVERLGGHRSVGDHPSRLPGWSIGHVLTHLARNADSHRRLIDAAMRGEVADQYPGGPAERANDIDMGADRALGEVQGDLRRAVWSLEAAWATCTMEGWNGRGRTNRGEVAISDLPFLRWREAEVHHADLGLGFTFEGWSPEYVRRELARQEMTWKARLPMGLGGLPAGALVLPPPLRLAWLLGREHVDGLPDVEGF